MKTIAPVLVLPLLALLAARAGLFVPRRGRERSAGHLPPAATGAPATGAPATGAPAAAEPKAAGKIRKMAQRFLVPGFAITFYYLLRDRTRISLRAEVELSPHLRFGRDCTVSSFTKIKASDGPLTVGRRSGFATGCFVSSGTGGIAIGDDVLVGPNVSIVGQTYVHDELDVPFADQGQVSKGIRIGNNVWIGANSVVADGASIGDNTIVVAGSLVTRRYPPNVIIQGNPAKVILERQRSTGGQGACERGFSASSNPPLPTSTRSSGIRSSRP